MKREKLTRIELLVATDTLKPTGEEFPNRARTIFNLLKEEGIDVKEVWESRMEWRIIPRHLILEGQGEVGCHKKGWGTRLWKG